MDSAFRVNRVDWRMKLAQYVRFALRWGWFVALTVMTVTVCSLIIPDAPPVSIYQATLQVQVPIPSGLTGLPTTNNTTAFFSSVMLSPSTLSLAIPEINKPENIKNHPFFKDFQLISLESVVTAAPVTDIPQILLSATSDSEPDAKFLVTTVYQGFLHYLHDQRYSIYNELHGDLTNELNQAQADFANSSSSLQNLTSTGKMTSFQFRELSNLNHAQREYINSINSLLLSLNTSIEGAGNSFAVSTSDPAITTLLPPSSTRGQRLALSPFVGLIMGLGGALLASQYSNRLSLRKKKRETVLPHIMGVIPGLALPRSKKKSRVTALQNASSTCQPLLLKLPYHFGGKGKAFRVITVTSPARREGKSTIAAMVAAASASKGLRTLLVDASLQRPVQHDWFAIPNTGGLSGTTRSYANEVIGSTSAQSTPVINLSIIPAGMIKQSGLSAGTDLLQVRELQSWIGFLRQKADLIVFDSSSLLTDPNAVHLAVLSDVTLLVVDAQRSRTSKAGEAEKVLKDLGIDFATALNRADRNSVE